MVEKGMPCLLPLHMMMSKSAEVTDKLVPVASQAITASWQLQRLHSYTLACTYYSQMNDAL